MMQTFTTLNDAIALAKFAHFKQTDKAGMPYIDHPRRVLAAVQAQGAMPYVQQAAVLHDVTEDTAFTPQMLLDLGFSEAVVRLVRLLDRKHARTLWEYDSAGGTADDYYYKWIRQSPEATMIKLADIADNTQAWRLNYLDPATQERLRAKYAKALTLLNAEIPASLPNYYAALSELEK